MARSLGYQLTLFPFVYSSIYQKEKKGGGKTRAVGSLEVGLTASRQQSVRTVYGLDRKCFWKPGLSMFWDGRTFIDGSADICDVWEPAGIQLFSLSSLGVQTILKSSSVNIRRHLEAGELHLLWPQLRLRTNASKEKKKWALTFWQAHILEIRRIFGEAFVSALCLICAAWKLCKTGGWGGKLSGMF